MPTQRQLFREETAAIFIDNNSPMLIPHDDRRLSWPGAISMERTPAYSRPWRIPFADRALFSPALVQMAATQAGVRLSFCSTTDEVKGRTVPFEKNQKLDLFVDGCFIATWDLKDQPAFEFKRLGTHEKLIELWLPQQGDFALEQLEIDDNATLRPYEDTRPRWITYGSSITHCRSSNSPSLTWPSIVARERNWNLTCLGYGGQCHLDIDIARMMRDQPADYISICAGGNIYSQSTLNQRSFRPSLIGFVRIIREKHPNTPILLLSSIYSKPRDETPNPHGMTLNDYRAAVEQAVNLLWEHGDKNIHFLSGLKIAGQEFHERMPDQFHPDSEATEIMARNFLAHAVPILAGER